MKNIILVSLILAIGLTACGSPAATPAPTAAEVVLPTDTPVPAQPAAVATDTPAPAGAAPTDTPESVQAPADTATPAGDEGGGGGVFTNLSRSGDAFSLRCAPPELTFSVTSTNAAITEVNLYYRVVDKAAANPTGVWRNGGKMNSDGNGNFTVIFPTVKIDPDSRAHVADGWFDYQFVGLNKYGDVVGRSDKITGKVTFTLDCK